MTESGIDPRLVVLTTDPANAETPLAATHGVITPNDLFFLRNRFSWPRLTAEDWRLQVTGLVERPSTLTYDDLLRLPRRTLTVTLECAGNGRSAFSPPAEGEPWAHGAVSTAEWTGVPLHLVLDRAGLDGTAREVLAYGADGGSPEAGRDYVPFARSLPLDKALDRDTLLVYAMNSEPLPVAHGFPLRLLVPGWYGMASVKWVVRLEAVAEPFEGFFQRERYVMVTPDEPEPRPLRQTRVRSLIVSPGGGQRVSSEGCMIRGYAWSGQAPVREVEVSVDGGRTWRAAGWSSEPSRYAWRGWEYAWRPRRTGRALLVSRARDEAGNVQPEVGEWNRLGYANNAMQRVEVVVIP